MSVRTAYLELLRIPHDAQRMRLQPVLAQLRDEIAAETGCTNEAIQNQFEACAAAIKDIEDNL